MVGLAEVFSCIAEIQQLPYAANLLTYRRNFVAVGNPGLATRLQKEASVTNPLKTFLSRYFYFSMSLLMAVLVIVGFSRTVDQNLVHASPPRPTLLWIHAAAFCTWVVFFIAQSALVRVRKVSVHRLLGWFGAALAGAMVVLGITIAVVMARFNGTVLQQKGAEAFLSVPFADISIFGTCLALAIYWRKKCEYHRRLIFVGSCQLMAAALGRFDFLIGNNLFYAALDLLVVLGMLRDWNVDGRVHKVYCYALPMMVVWQYSAIYLWKANPAWWQGVTRAIVGV